MAKEEPNPQNAILQAINAMRTDMNHRFRIMEERVG